MLKVGLISTSPLSFGLQKVLSNHADFEVERIKNVSNKPPKKDLFFVSHFDQIVPPEWFNSAKHGALNLHFSKLPKFRGPAPVQWAIISGEKEVGISVIKINQEFDKGAVVWQKTYPLLPNYHSDQVYKNLYQTISPKVPQIINQYIKDKTNITPQPNKNVGIYARRLLKKDGFLDLKILKSVLYKKPLQNCCMPEVLKHAKRKLSPLAVHDMVRGLYPWPGVYTFFTHHQKDLRLKILETRVFKNRLQIKRVQVEGKKPISWQVFKNGYKI